MPEGVATAAGRVIGEGVFDDKDAPPAPDPVKAPKGWTWSRTDRKWIPKVRGPLLASAAPADAPDAPGPDPRPGQDAGAFAFGHPADRDPDPGWQGGGGVPAEPQWKLDPVARADIKALIALAYTIPAEVLPLADPYCFGPLEQERTATGVINAVADIVCASPRVAKWAASAAGLMPWIKLGQALKPVAVAALHHHVLRDVDVEVDRRAKTMTVDRKDWTELYPVPPAPQPQAA